MAKKKLTKAQKQERKELAAKFLAAMVGRERSAFDSSAHADKARGAVKYADELLKALE